jgi:hypothetical protein
MTSTAAKTAIFGRRSSLTNARHALAALRQMSAFVPKSGAMFTTASVMISHLW